MNSQEIKLFVLYGHAGGKVMGLSESAGLFLSGQCLNKSVHTEVMEISQPGPARSTDRQTISADI